MVGGDIELLKGFYSIFVTIHLVYDLPSVPHSCLVLSADKI
ncbi:unnamed protein product [Acidithrix sp. C25]|nr:unnamed protein product [Acidithrix sp. C25]